jgi:hypothetical protein
LIIFFAICHADARRGADPDITPLFSLMPLLITPFRFLIFDFDYEPLFSDDDFHAAVLEQLRYAFAEFSCLPALFR